MSEPLPNDFWYTPPYVWKCIVQFFGKMPSDPCPANPDFDGLAIHWDSDSYINPPFSKKLKRAFVNKAIEQYNGGRYLWMFNYANSKDLWEVHKRASAIMIPQKRIEFVAGHPELATDSSPMYDNIMILWGDPTGFKEAFAPVGKVYTLPA